MRNLFLLRHAQAAHAAEDRDRPLSPQGRQDISALAQKMTASNMIPDYIMCSPAKRTRETCDVLMKTLPKVSIIYPEYMYEATTSDLFNTVQKVADSCKTLLIIGHNPSIQSLVRLLTDETNDNLNDVIYSYRPGTISAIECEIDEWQSIQPAENNLKKVIAP